MSKRDRFFSLGGTEGDVFVWEWVDKKKNMCIITMSPSKRRLSTCITKTRKEWLPSENIIDFFVSDFSRKHTPLVEK